jgi:hypothetical protein
MIAWDSMTIDPSDSEKAAISPATGVFYRLMVAFPVWAGAFLAFRALFSSGTFLSKLDIFRIRPR